MKLINWIFLFLIIGFLLILTNREYDLKDSNQRTTLLKEFSKWVITLGKNVYDITLYAIKKPWLPENVSIEKTINTTSKIIKQNNLTNLTNQTLNETNVR
ncbi:MAG: hypothetical protein QXR30_02335 [Candidatus Woesearchaeota archaeon]